MPKLVVKSPEFAGMVLKLDQPKVTVGRVDDNQFSLDHPSVSSHHAELILDGGDYRLVDLGSTNGTRVNDEKISEAILRNNDVVMFGNILLSYESENAASSQPLPKAENRVDLSSGGGKPLEFRNLAPFSKPKPSKGSFPLPILLAALVSLGGAGYLVYVLFLS